MMTEQQVVVIGGSEGIGLAVAKAARTPGTRVLAVSTTREKLELFSELSTVDHVYIAAGSTKIGGVLDYPLKEFRHKFDERLCGSVDVVRAAHHLVRSGGSFTFTGGLSFRPACEGSLGVWYCDHGD